MDRHRTLYRNEQVGILLVVPEKTSPTTGKIYKPERYMDQQVLSNLKQLFETVGDGAENLLINATVENTRMQFGEIQSPNIKENPKFIVVHNNAGTTHYFGVFVNLKETSQDSLGRFYGFPDCCIDYFMSDAFWEDRKNDYIAVFDGTGYIACPCCNQKVKDDLQAEINAKRSASVPFPEVTDSNYSLVLEYSEYVLAFAQGKLNPPEDKNT